MPYEPDLPSICDPKIINSFADLNEAEPGLGDKMRNLLNPKQKGQTVMTNRLKTNKNKNKDKGKKPEPATKPDTKPKKGEQLDLIDVNPENMTKIIPLARTYMGIVKKRVALTDQETNAKEALRAEVGAAKLKRLPGGSIKFRCDGLLITITPTDEKIKVKEVED